MNYKVATCFSDDTWQAYGLSWLQHAKSARLKGFVVGLGLSEDALRSVTEMGFEYLGIPMQPRMRASSRSEKDPVISRGRWNMRAMNEKTHT